MNRSALLIVDVQLDFCPGGALPVPNGDEVVPVLNAYIARFRAAGLPIYASRDWHPANTHHFKAFGGAWPPHCVQGKPGAAFHPDLELPPDVPIISAGMEIDEEGYSSFEGRLPDGETFAERLRRDGVGHLSLGGLATDYCVRASALDARRLGLEVTLLVDASRGIDVQPGDVQRAIDEMRAAGIDVGTLDTVNLAPAER